VTQDDLKREIPSYDEDMTILSEEGRGERFADLLEQRLSRRGLLKAGLAAGAFALVAPVVGGGRSAAAAPQSSNVGMAAFTPLPPQPASSQTVLVAPGHAWAPLLKWGDPIRAGGPAWDPQNQSAAKQAEQIGYNCDYIGWHPLPFNGKNPNRGLLWVNHEYTNPELMFAGYNAADPTREQVDVEIEAHGGSIVELNGNGQGPLQVNLGSGYNRRITGTTPMTISGPAAGHAWMQTSTDPTGTVVLGTLNNCAGGFTPWGTVLTCEENFHQYFGNLTSLPVDDPRRSAHARYGMPGGASSRKWERFHPRFDVGQEPNEAFRFGWVVEVDPYDPQSVPVKRTALGRFRHEGATFGLSKSGRVAFYSGDDQVFEYVYKYVSDDAWTPRRPEVGKQLLDKGVLYVARFNADGSGEWLPLVYGQGPLTEANGFTSQADVLIRTRQAADALGATKMDRPEDMQQNPVNKKVYLACTNNTQRGTTGRPDVDAANPRAGNRHGHIIEITETNDDCAATTFSWDIFILCGDPADPSTYFAGFPKDFVSPISSPDNVNFDVNGNLWISSDGMPGALNLVDGLYAVPTEGPNRGFLKLFLTVVAGAECASFDFTSDYRNLFVSVQHPGEDGTVENPITTWPDGVPYPRPTVIQVWPTRNGRRIGAS
jgi:secreted PhoX family phosphatase